MGFAHVFRASVAVLVFFVPSISFAVDGDLTPVGTVGKKEIVCRLSNTEKIQLGILRGQARRFSPLQKYIQSKRKRLEGTKLKQFNKKWRKNQRRLRALCEELLAPDIQPVPTPTPNETPTPTPTPREVLFFGNGPEVDTIDIATNTVTEDIFQSSHEGASNVRAHEFSKELNSIFWSDYFDRTIKRKNLSTGAIDTIISGNSYSALEVSPEGKLIYSVGSRLFEFDLLAPSSPQMIADTDFFPIEAIETGTFSDQLVITTWNKVGIYRKDLDMTTTLFSIPTGDQIISSSVDTSRDLVYVLFFGGQGYQLVKVPLTEGEITPIPLEILPWFFAKVVYDPQTQHLFMSDRDSLHELNLLGHELRTIELPHEGFWVEWFALRSGTHSILYGLEYPSQILHLNTRVPSDSGVIVQALSFVGDLEFDEKMQKLYWRDWGKSDIIQAEVEDPESAQILRHIPTGSSSSAGLALDSRNGLLYWNEGPDISGMLLSVPESQVNFPRTEGGDNSCLLSLDPKNGQVLWSDYDYQLSSSNAFSVIPEVGFVEQLFSGEFRVRAIISGHVSDKLYFIADEPFPGQSFIGVFDRQSNELTQLFTDLPRPMGLALNSDETRIFWTDDALDTVNSASTAGGASEVIAEIPGAALFGIEFGLVQE
ncbi:MAG: hypothetical protein KDD64_06680 [Bdellovibrionales bacterium]|nr:hypothetical protein [Bdellovibrionales bacterium]